MTKAIPIFHDDRIVILQFEPLVKIKLAQNFPINSVLDDSAIHPRNIIGRKQNYYSEHSRNKNGQRSRPLASPNTELKEIQRKVLKHFDRLLTENVHPSAYGYVRGKSAIHAARSHQGMTWAVKLDLKDFFLTIDETRIFNTFRSFGLKRQYSAALAKTVTYIPDLSPASLPAKYSRVQKHRKLWGKSRKIGLLPQGSPTSGFIANLICLDLDEQLEALAGYFNLRYTRYSDDILLSSCEPFDRTLAEDVFKSAKLLLRLSEFEINPKKSRIVTPGSRKRYLGINIGEDRLSCPRESKRAFDRKLRQLTFQGLHETCKSQGVSDVELFKSLKGQLEWVFAVEGSGYESATENWVSTRKARLLEIFGEHCACWMCNMGAALHSKILPKHLH